MKTPQPIIMLRQRNNDEAVHAFHTIADAVRHLNEAERLEGTDLAEAEFFDSKGRRLEPSVGPDGGLADLRVESEDSHADHVRERVRRRCQAVKTKDPGAASAVTELADEGTRFETFASRLAKLLDPQPKPLPHGHTAGFWHNMFGH